MAVNRQWRSALAILAGVAIWTLLWSFGTQAAMAIFPHLLQAGQPIAHPGMLVMYIGYSTVLSALAGFTTATIARSNPRPAVALLATVQLGLGILAELSYWALMPVWYHIVFLALVVPATLYGGFLQQIGTTSGRQAPG